MSRAETLLNRLEQFWFTERDMFGATTTEAIADAIGCDGESAERIRDRLFNLYMGEGFAARDEARQIIELEMEVFD